MPHAHTDGDACSVRSGHAWPRSSPETAGCTWTLRGTWCDLLARRHFSKRNDRIRGDQNWCNGLRVWTHGLQLPSSRDLGRPGCTTETTLVVSSIRFELLSPFLSRKLVTSLPKLASFFLLSIFWGRRCSCVFWAPEPNFVPALGLSAFFCSPKVLDLGFRFHVSGFRYQGFKTLRLYDLNLKLQVGFKV